MFVLYFSPNLFLNHNKLNKQAGGGKEEKGKKSKDGKKDKKEKKDKKDKKDKKVSLPESFSF